MVRATLQRSTAPLPTSPRTGGGACGARNFNLACDGFEHAIGVLQNVVVPEADDAVAVGFDAGRPLRISVNRMLPAVAFDRQTQASTREIDHAAANRKLPRKSRAHLPPAQLRPQRTFRVRHVVPQFARGAGQSLFGQGRTPPPSLPLKGEGLGVAQ